MGFEGGLVSTSEVPRKGHAFGIDWLKLDNPEEHSSEIG